MQRKNTLALAMRAGKLPGWIHFNEEFDDVEPELEENNDDEVEHELNTNGRIKALEQNQQVLQALSDPDVRRVLELKAQGKKFSISDGEEEEEEPVEDLEDDAIDENDPLAPTLKKISELIDKKLGKKLSALDKINERIEGVEGLASTIQKKEVVEQVKAATAKYKDLPQYKDKMLELTRQFPGLNVEELYILARSRSGKLKLNEPSTFSEKPSNQPRRRAEQGKKKAPTPTGRKGFESILSESLGRLEFGDLE